MNTPSLRWINVIAFAVALLLNYLANALPLNGYTTGQLSDLYPNLLVPASFAFGIWGLIYLSLLGFLVYQFTGGQPARDLVAAIGPWFFINGLANASWIVAWHYRQVGLALVIMLVLWVSLFVIYTRTMSVAGGKVPRLTAQYLLGVFPFSLYFGWITLATTLNVTTLLVALGWSGAPLSPVLWTVIVMAVVTLIGLYILYAHRDYAFMGVIIWAFYAIYVRRGGEVALDTSPIVTTAIVGIVILLIVAALRMLRLVRPATAS